MNASICLRRLLLRWRKPRERNYLPSSELWCKHNVTHARQQNNIETRREWPTRPQPVIAPRPLKRSLTGNGGPWAESKQDRPYDLQCSTRNCRRSRLRCCIGRDDVAMSFPDKSVAPSAAFVDCFAISVVIGCVQLPWPCW